MEIPNSLIAATPFTSHSLPHPLPPNPLLHPLDCSSEMINLILAMTNSLLADDSGLGTRVQH